MENSLFRAGVLLLLLVPLLAWGEKAPSAIRGAPFEYRGWWTARPASAGFHQLSLVAPVLLGESGSTLVGLMGSRLAFEEAPLLGPGRPIPRILRRAELSVIWNRSLEQGDRLGFRGTLGSASDELFSGERSLDYSGVFSYSLRSSERSRWIFSAYISNHGIFRENIPIPGLAYSYQNEEFSLLVGMPMINLAWRPSPSFYAQLSILARNMQAELGGGEKVQAFFRAAWTQEHYRPRARLQAEDRLYLEEKRLALGARIPILKGWISEVSGGPVLGRSVYEGVRKALRRSGSSDLPDTWAAVWSLKYAM